MEIIKIVGIGIVATVFIIILKSTRPEFALYKHINWCSYFHHDFRRIILCNTDFEYFS